MSFDLHTNFAYATVVTAPSPASSGTSLTVAAGLGALFAAVPANATVWPAGLNAPLSTNAEIVRVTGRSGDVLTIARAQEGTSARTILAGDQLAITMTAKMLTDVETAGSPPFTIANGSALALNAALVEMIGVNPNGLLVLGGDVVLAKAVVATMDRDQLGIDSNALEIHGTAGAAPVRLEAFSFFNTDVSIDIIAQGAGTINLTAPVVASGTVTAIDYQLPAFTAHDLLLSGFENTEWDGEAALWIRDSNDAASDKTASILIGGGSLKSGALITGIGSDAGATVEITPYREDGETHGTVDIQAGGGDTKIIIIDNGGTAGQIQLSVQGASFTLQEGVVTPFAFAGGPASFDSPVTASDFIGPVLFPMSDPGIPGAWWNNAGTLVMSV